jgi:hypothetical protein
LNWYVCMFCFPSLLLSDFLLKWHDGQIACYRPSQKECALHARMKVTSAYPLCIR